MRRTAALRGLGAVIAILLVLGLGADAYAQTFFDSLPSIQGLDSAAFAGDTLITDSTGKVELADVGNHGDHRLAVKLKDISPVAVQATVAIEDRGFYSNPGFDIGGIVRAVFDAALKRELHEVMQETQVRANQIKEPADLWELESYLNRRRKDIDRKYDFRSSRLTSVFGRLLFEHRVSEDELRGLGEDKRKAIHACAQFLIEDAA